MVLIVRVQSASGLHRVHLISVESTWSELQAKINAKFNVPESEQCISRTRLHKPNFIKADSNMAVGALGIEHGTMLFLKDSAQSTSDSKSSFKLTAQCQHSAKGRCIKCLPKASKNAAIATWLCTHPSSAFCPKCLPPNPDEDKATLSSAKPNDVGEAFKVDVIPYAQFMSERQSMCRFKHSVSTVCGSCAPPDKLEYIGKAKCSNSHRPWPQGICGRCAPPNAVLHLQKYRHCDGISFKDVSAGERFISEWNSNPALQRAALLFGRYIDEPTASKNMGAIRAEVEALYVPPVELMPEGVKFLRDPNEKNVMKVAKALGLDFVGWAVTTLPRFDEEYGGDVLMSGREVRQAARFQSKFANEKGHSRLVTMIIQHNKQGGIEPRAYQISDQGVAMERDGLISEGSKAGYIQPRVEKKGEFVASIVYKAKLLPPGEDFLPDELLVKVIAMKPYKPKPMFKFVHFPFNGTDQHLRSFLQRHANLPYHEKLSDFLLLVYLAKKIGVELVCLVATAIKEKRAVCKETQSKLDQSLATFI